jgi:hypothetical protein
MKMADHEVLDLGGGQNDGLDPSQIKDSEFPELVNFFTYGRDIVRRGGIERLTSSASAEAVTSLFSFKNSDTLAWTLFVGLAAGIGRKDGGGITKLPVTDGQVYSSDSSPWTLAAYNNVGYAVRRNSGRMKRFTFDTVFDAGIVAPSAALTLSDAGAGSLPAGTYRMVATLYNSDNGAESDMSPVSNALTIGANRGIAVSGIPTAVPAGQVNARRLWRTLVDQQGEYFLDTLVPDNVTTSATTNVLTLGAAVSRRNGLPPTGAKYMTFWNERCILSDGFRWYPSEVGMPESFGGTAVGLFPDDGHQQRALCGWGDRLVVGKPNVVAYYLETENSFERRILSDKHGIWSHWSTRVVEDQLLWYGGDNVYRSAGGAPAAISTYKVRRVLDAIPDAQKEDVFAAVYPKRSWYLLSVPQASGRKILVYNYKTDSWSVFETPDAMGFIADAFDANEAEVLYGALSNAGHIYQLDRGYTDYGTAITARARFKRQTFGAPGFLRALARVKLLCSSIAANATLRLYRNGEDSAVKTRTVSLNLTPDWKTYALSNRRRPGSSLQIEIEYSGSPVLTLSGVAYDVMDTKRRSMRAA